MNVMSASVCSYAFYVVRAHYVMHVCYGVICNVCMLCVYVRTHACMYFLGMLCCVFMFLYVCMLCYVCSIDSDLCEIFAFVYVCCVCMYVMYVC